ncbi:hypothetical protein K435DRAFT_806162 [Dendrothele bispora CBS 962.96]|uniref:HMG box domain-containing protein n=1 Tax=Dendrothele bispora (strain CBS 962.96) TaxID=1314807 RepID=A0A4S8L981_DENBC|nr:hypothetical protein K435DRAFT_806162 [Dendrothele bispora CBS 962.96]
MLNLAVRLVSATATNTLCLSRVAPFVTSSNLLSRAILSPVQSRSFLTSAHLRFAAKASATGTKASVGHPKKAAPKKKPAVKKNAPKKKPAKRVATKPKKRTFDRSLMVPPKRAPTPYFIFNTERIRAANVKNLDDAKVVVKETAELWGRMSEGEKQVYHERSIVARADYLQAYEAWFKALPPGYLLEINRRRVAKGKLKLHRPTTLPKRPSPPFTAFLKNYRDQHAITGPFTVSLPDIHAAWKNLPESEKETYYKQYKDACEEWRKQAKA